MEEEEKGHEDDSNDSNGGRKKRIRKKLTNKLIEKLARELRQVSENTRVGIETCGMSNKYNSKFHPWFNFGLSDTIVQVKTQITDPYLIKC